MPIHDVGISIALLPGYALGNRLGAMIELNLFGAIVAAGVFQLAIVLGATAASAISCWALFAFVSPLITYSSQVYPEVAGAALMIWAVIAFARFMRSRSSTALLIVGLLLAVVPWLSVRYWVVLGPLGIAMVLYLTATLRPFSALLQGLVLLGLPMAVSVLVFSLLDLGCSPPYRTRCRISALCSNHGRLHVPASVTGRFTGTVFRSRLWTATDRADFTW